VCHGRECVGQGRDCVCRNREVGVEIESERAEIGSAYVKW